MNTTLWRQIPQRGLSVYFAGISVTVLLMMGAGYSGGEMVFGAETTGAAALPPASRAASQETRLAMARTGQQLFLRNCAHCHGADARGDEGPDLHNLDWTDEQIGTRIRNGKKGQMTAFAGKLSPQQISEVIAYLRTLK